MGRPVPARYTSQCDRIRRARARAHRPAVRAGRPGVLRGSGGGVMADRTETAGTETAGTETDDSQAATVPVAASAVWARQFGRWWPWLVGTLVVVALLGLQSQLYAGQKRTVSTVFMYVALAQGWNVI